MTQPHNKAKTLSKTEAKAAAKIEMAFKTGKLTWDQAHGLAKIIAWCESEDFQAILVDILDTE